MSLVPRASLSLLFAVGIGAGCAPIPDFKVTARDIPAGTTHLVVSMLDERGTPPKQSLAIPVSEDKRGGLLIGLQLPPGSETATLSLATVDADRCITSVLPATRIAGRSSQLELILDPAQNPSVVTLNSELRAPAACPKVTIDEALNVPREPRVINVSRDFRMALPTARGSVNLYGWSFDHSTLEMARSAALLVMVPAEMCLSNIILKSLLESPCGDPLIYPAESVSYISYAQLSLDFAKIRQACPQATDVQILSTGAFNAFSYTIRNPDGATATYRESTQPLVVQ